MRSRQLPTAAEAIAVALGAVERLERVLVVDLEPSVAAGVGNAHLTPMTLSDLLQGRPDAPHDAALLGPIAGPLDESLCAARAQVRSGGLVALLAPVAQGGLRGMTPWVLSMVDARRRPRPLEELCAAMLAAHVVPVRVVRVRGARGEAWVHGRVVSLDP